MNKRLLYSARNTIFLFACLHAGVLLIDAIIRGTFQEFSLTNILDLSKLTQSPDVLNITWFSFLIYGIVVLVFYLVSKPQK